MNPTTRFIARAAIAALLTGLASYQASHDIVQAVIAAVVGLGAYAGIGAATPVEPKVGIKTKT